MFTGIVENTGSVISLEERRGQRRFTIATGFKDLALGESVSVNGVCLTVTEFDDKGQAQFFVSEESLERSNLRLAEAGTKLNLERAMPANGRFSGHFVQGHVDTTGMLLSIIPGADHHRLMVALDPKYGRYCVEKGSISLNGVSLTINSLEETKAGEFMISCLIIPHTWKSTTFSDLMPGDQLNVEIDVLAKYIERLCPYLEKPLLP